MYLLEPNKPNGIFIREYGILCNVCIKDKVQSCQVAEPNQNFQDSIDVLKARWYQFHKIYSDEDDDDELEEIDMFLESDVTKYNVKGNVGIICTGDDHNYYLAKLITVTHETGESGMDDKNHEMPVLQKVITCSYLEIIKIQKTAPSITLKIKRKPRYLLTA